MTQDHERELIAHPIFRPPAFPGLWGEMESRLSEWIGREENKGISVSEDDQHIYIEAHLPGLKSNDIDISLNQSVLWIKGEKQEEEKKGKKYYRQARSSFFYQVNLPSQVEEKTEQTHFEDGVLKITFTKAKESQVRKISIKHENQNHQPCSNKNHSHHK